MSNICSVMYLGQIIILDVGILLLSKRTDYINESLLPGSELYGKIF